MLKTCHASNLSTYLSIEGMIMKISRNIYKQGSILMKILVFLSLKVSFSGVFFHKQNLGQLVRLSPLIRSYVQLFEIHPWWPPPPPPRNKNGAAFEHLPYFHLHEIKKKKHIDALVNLEILQLLFYMEEVCFRAFFFFFRDNQESGLEMLL